MATLNLLSATEAAKQIAAGKITSEQLLRDCLDHIADREPAVGAWAYLNVNADAAIQRARELDQTPSSSRGLLHGIPIAVKDLIDTCDMPATYGSAIYAGHRPPWDAPCVALARAAGAVVLGKTVSTELAYFTPGKTANPNNLAHTPGGSSSGSAAAVADHMTPLAFGTQTAGSVIRPAAFCGVVGYKPSFGLISRVGAKPLSDAMDTVGTLARSVPDAALFAAVASGRHDLIIEQPPASAPCVGICHTFEWAHAQPETHAAMALAINKLGAAGVTMINVELPPNFAGVVQAQMDIMTYEMARSLAYEWHAHRARLSQKLQDLIAAGLTLPRERYDAAVTLARNARRMTGELFARADVLLAPSAVGEAPLGLEATGDPLFNRMWTILHTPCVHLPFTQGPNGLPVGLQVVGPRGADRQTLLCADYLLRTLC
jgi:Asp-tRNA(Asn)/Glu-tRNA(Gln) amidotransferase A subunit family amidase